MAGKPKTRDRILQTSLALFNAEGEAQVSTVDIAAVLGISPGNLYYHFKGKEAIIEALYADFEEEIRMVLTAPVGRALALKDNWIFVYIIFEEINDFRFFYEGMASILERCDALRPKFARLLALKHDTCVALLSALEAEKFVAFTGEEKARLAERLVMHLAFWLPYRAMADKKLSDRAAINDGVYNALLQIAPFVVEDREAYTVLLGDYFRKQKG